MRSPFEGCGEGSGLGGPDFCVTLMLPLLCLSALEKAVSGSELSRLDSMPAQDVVALIINPASFFGSI